MTCYMYTLLVSFSVCTETLITKIISGEMCIRDLSPAFCAYEIPVTHKCNNSQVLYISDYVIRTGINLLCLLSYLSCCMLLRDT